MRVTVLSFHPESLDQVEARLRALLPNWAEAEIDLVFPSVAFGDDPGWDEAVAPELETRLRAVGRPIRVLHVEPRQFVEELFQAQPPAMVVIAYTHYSERVAMTANMLATRRFPVLMVGYEP